MANLNNVVTVNITSTVSTVRKQTFDKALILDYHTKFAEHVKAYSDIAGLEADGFVETDAAHIIASAMFAQSPAPSQVKIGRRALAPDLEIRLTPTAVNSTVYTVTVDGEEASYTSDSSATVAEITAGLASAISALSISGLSVSDQTTYVRLKGSSAGRFIRASVANLSLISISQNHADPGAATDLAAISLENSDFYVVIPTTASSAELVAINTWCAANNKALVAQTQDSAVINTTSGNAAATLLASNAPNTSLFWYPDNGVSLVGAAMGAHLPNPAGGSNLMFVSPVGVPVVELTQTQINNLKANRCNFLADFGGGPIIAYGYSSGTAGFFDQTRGRAWIKAEIQADIYAALARANKAGKAPATKSGMVIVSAAIKKSFEKGINRGYLSKDDEHTVTLPVFADVRDELVLTRVLTGVTFSFVEANAINGAVVSGYFE